MKSLAFWGVRSGRLVLVLVGGANRVQEGVISAMLSEPVGKADAAFVRQKTGFSIGGILSVGHLEDPITFMDEALLRETEVWAAGHTHAVFGLPPRKLAELTGGRLIEVS